MVYDVERMHTKPLCISQAILDKTASITFFESDLLSKKWISGI
jgi:hypothetical protein